MPPLQQPRVPGHDGCIALVPPPWFPPSNDIFWLNAAFRLPDGAATLTEYGVRRAAVFEKAGIVQNGQGDGADVEMVDAGSEDGGRTAWEQAWAELRRALCK
ncbi:hypothetical protein Tdes44962_MAKER03876 [Teratosphaeria destructans]|uniref:Uncharacterized protein n=1 Tax=Teratosphaeria destructans TaxID=418781 RepID=A0A9W7W0M3_9PEZI|nr:hypothetical protein Tdes44962_MAKER03876 [Teratosphaeria destructans]